MKVPIKLTTASKSPELTDPIVRHTPEGPQQPPQAYREIAYTDPRDGIERHLPMPQPDPKNFVPCALFMSLVWDAQVSELRESELTALELDALNAAFASLPLDKQDYDRRQHPHPDWTLLVFSGKKG